MAKGSSFEREVCKQLGLWWSNDKRDDIFWRTAGSGAMATVRRKVNKETFGQSGDVQAVDPIGQPLIDLVSIELKRGYNRATLHDVIDKSPRAKEQQIERFIKQARTDCKNSTSWSWMLVTKRDRRQPLVFIPLKLVRLIFGNTNFLSKIEAPHGCFYIAKKRKVFVYKFDSFLKSITPKEIKKINEKRR